MRSLVLALVLLNLIAGCASYQPMERPSSQAAAIKIPEATLRIGQTTKAEILNLLGPPASVSFLPMGLMNTPVDILTYNFRPAKFLLHMIAVDGTQYDMLAARIDLGVSQGVLQGTGNHSPE